VNAIARTAVWVVTESEKRRYVSISDKPDVSTLSAISTIGSAKGHRTFTTEADTACATISTTDI
jgi:hypothetical protein